MKKIIFFFFLFFIFSKSAFSHEYDKPCSADWFQYVEDYPSEIYGTDTEFIVDEQRFPHPNFGSSKFCYFLGFVEISATAEAVASDTFTYYHSWFITWDLIEPNFVEEPDFDCLFENMLFYLVDYFDDKVFEHEQCISDASAWNTSIDEVCWFVNPFFFHESKRLAFYCTVKPVQSSLELSQKTLKKTNDLISESNSKLGLIAGGTAAQTGLLNDILNSFRSFLTKTAGLFGTGDFAGNSEEDNSFIDFFNRDSSRNVAAIQPLVFSSSSSCPAPISVSFFGRSSNFSYQPTCDFATRIRPIVVNAARVAAAWILIGAAL